jgi:uncharacterized membrane protein
VAERDLDRPKGEKSSLRIRRRARRNPEREGEWAESIARFLGTPSFIVWLTLFVVAWILWNTLAPVNLRFDDSRPSTCASTSGASSR